jgi:hypothetical protein
MGAAGNKKPKKDKSKHGKHVPSYQAEAEKQDVEVLKKKK